MGRHRRRKKTQAEQADWMCCSMYWSCAGCDCEPLELSVCTYASASENTRLCWESGWCKILNKHCHVREMDMCNKPHSGSQKSGDMRKQSSWYPQSKTSGTSPKSSQACHHKAVMLQRGPNFTLFFTWPFLYFYSESLLVCLKKIRNTNMKPFSKLPPRVFLIIGLSSSRLIIFLLTRFVRINSNTNNFLKNQIVMFTS